MCSSFTGSSCILSLTDLAYLITEGAFLFKKPPVESIPEIVSEIMNLLTSLDVSRLSSWFGVLP